MDAAGPGARSLWRVEAALFALLFASFAYFHHALPGWNVNSRLALTFALVERGTVRIDAYADRADMETDDVAEFGGHLYSDKIIGTSLLGVPAFAAVRAGELAAGAPWPTPVRRHLVTVFSVGLLSAFAGFFLFRILRLLCLRAGLAPRDAVAGALVVTALTFLGTMLWFYATLFMSYLPAAFFTLWAVWRFEAWLERRAAQDAAADAGDPPLFTVGLLLGCAVLCEYTVALVACIFGAYVLAVIPRRACVWRLVAGGILPLIPFLVYTYAIFGRFAIPYQFERNAMFRERMAAGFMGLGAPRVSVLALVTVHPYRGLFVHSPFLVVGIAGLWAMLRGGRQRAFGAMCAAVVAAYLLFNSSYYMWWGGWSFAARHLAPAVPFLAIGVAAAWRWRWARWAVALLGAVAVALHLVVVSVEPQIRDLNPSTPLDILMNPSLANDYVWLFPRHILRLFEYGQLGQNLGQLPGLEGLWSLAPLLALWAVGGALLWRLVVAKPEPRS